jgi:hypothetical protein
MGLEAEEHFASKSVQIVLGQFLSRLLRHFGQCLVEGRIGLRIARAPHALGVKFDKGRGQGLRTVLAFC